MHKSMPLGSSFAADILAVHIQLNRLHSLFGQIVQELQAYANQKQIKYLTIS